MVFTDYEEHAFTINCVDGSGIEYSSNELRVSVVKELAPVTADPDTATHAGTTLSGTIPGGTWTCSGCPNQTDSWREFVAGDEWGSTDPMLGLENSVREPGVETKSEDCKNLSVSQFCSDDADVQITAYTDATYEFELPEASEQGFGWNMFTGGYMKLVMPDGVEIEVDSDEETSWIVYVGGPLNADLSTPHDGNLEIKLVGNDQSTVRDENEDDENFNSGFTMRTMLPPGQAVSKNYTLANVIAAMTHECGNDGCNRVAILVYLMEDQSVSVVYINKSDMIVNPAFANWK
jgi:hypothetical protein